LGQDCGWLLAKALYAVDIERDLFVVLNGKGGEWAWRVEEERPSRDKFRITYSAAGTA
jgi:hypothetical protein